MPDEYTELLNTAKADTTIMVDEKLSDAAKIYVPKLYKILIDNGYQPKPARVIIIDDCKKIWTQRHVLRWMPEETKDQKKRIAGQKSRENAKAKKDQELQQFIDEFKESVPEIEDMDKDTQKNIHTIVKAKRGLGSPKVTAATIRAIARQGGIAKSEQHPEQMSEMGKAGMESRWGSKQQLVQLHIEDEEHNEILEAYKQSMIARANGSGGYIIFVKNGEFDHAEPSSGNAEKTVNK